MKLKKYKMIKAGIAFMFAIALLTGFQTDMQQVEAKTTKTAAKKTAGLSGSKMTIGLGKSGSMGELSWGSARDKYSLSVVNAVKGATYTFTSSDSKKVSVKTKGYKTYLTGKRAGSVTITCKQKLNGKTTTIGTCKVTVKNSALKFVGYAENAADEMVQLPLGEYNFGSDTHPYYISYRNHDAEYTYVTDSQDLTITESEDIETNQYYKDLTFYNTEYNAKKPGIYIVTVKEEYNKKTRTVGSFTVSVHAAEVAATYNLALNDILPWYVIADYTTADRSYYIMGDGYDITKKTDSSIVYTETKTDYYDMGEQLYLCAGKEGTAKVNVYDYIEETSEIGALLGTCTITVSRIDATDIYMEDLKTYVGSKETYLGVYKEPNNATDEVKLTSSDESTAKVVFDEVDSVWYILPVKQGEVTVTAKCGNVTAACKITVYADEDEYNSYN